MLVTFDRFYLRSSFSLSLISQPKNVRLIIKYSQSSLVLPALVTTILFVCFSCFQTVVSEKECWENVKAILQKFKQLREDEGAD